MTEFCTTPKTIGFLLLLFSPLFGGLYLLYNIYPGLSDSLIVLTVFISTSGVFLGIFLYLHLIKKLRMENKIK